MDDGFVMRVLHRVADFYEQLEALVDGEFMAVTVIVDGTAFHIIHDEIRRSFRGTTAVEQLYDIRMIEICESLPLLAESVQQFTALPSGLHQLDRHLLLICIVITHG